MLCASCMQEWDYTVLNVADPLTKLLDIAQSVRVAPLAASCKCDTCVGSVAPVRSQHHLFTSGEFHQAGAILTARQKSSCTAGGSCRPVVAA